MDDSFFLALFLPSGNACVDFSCRSVNHRDCCSHKRECDVGRRWTLAAKRKTGLLLFFFSLEREGKSFFSEDSINKRNSTYRYPATRGKVTSTIPKEKKVAIVVCLYIFCPLLETFDGFYKYLTGFHRLLAELHSIGFVRPHRRTYLSFPQKNTFFFIPLDQTAR